MVYGRDKWPIARQEEKRQEFWTERKGEGRQARGDGKEGGHAGGQVKAMSHMAAHRVIEMG